MIWDERIDTNLRKAEAYDEGREEGIKEGKRESKIEIIKNLFQKGVNINTIAEYSNLSVNEVNRIIEKD